MKRLRIVVPLLFLAICLSISLYFDRPSRFQLPTEMLARSPAPAERPQRSEAAQPIAPAKPSNVPVAGLAELLKEKGYVAIPLERVSSRQFIVRAQIEDKPFVLVVDTGAGHSHLDQYRTRSLALDWDDDPKCEIAGIRIGEVKTAKLVMRGWDLSGTNRAAKFANDPLVDGILGADVLHPHAAVFDQAGAILYLKKLPEKEK